MYLTADYVFIKGYRVFHDFKIQCDLQVQFIEIYVALWFDSNLRVRPEVVFPFC